MKDNIGFCLSNSKELAQRVATAAKYVKEEVSGVDVSIFTKMSGAFNVPCGVFSYPEMWYFKGYMFTFELSDIEYIVRTQQPIHPVFLYLGQPMDLLGLLLTMKNNKIDCVTSSDEQKDDFFRLTNVQTPQLKDYIKEKTR